MDHREESFGVIPLRSQNNIWEVFLIQHQHARYWGFPKGHAEPGETPELAATRELKEETHLDIVRFLQTDPIVEQYQFVLDKRRVYKKVFYFVAVVSGEISLQKKEIANGMWLPISQALQQLTHPEGKSILQQVKTILEKL